MLFKAYNPEDQNEYNSKYIYIYKIVIDRLCSYFTDATKTYKDGV